MTAGHLKDSLGDRGSVVNGHAAPAPTKEESAEERQRGARQLAPGIGIIRDDTEVMLAR
jgi:hypothetical protein